MNNEIPPGYESFWINSEFYNPLPLDIKSVKAGNSTAPRSPSPHLTDGQISIALDSGLMQLIENISLEISRASTEVSSTAGSGIHSDLRSSGVVDLNQSHFPSRATSLNERSTLADVQWGVPSRSSSAHHSRSSFSSALGTTYSESAQVVPIFKPVASAPVQFPPRIVSARTESTTSRALSSTSDVEPLPQVLHALDKEPDECIIVVRRITRLGFKSNRIIKSRFEHMGWDVRNVVLLPSRSRPAEGSPFGSVPHARPSSMGFVVFGNAKQAAECLSLGSIDVDGIEVLVQPFARQYKPTNARETS